MVAVTTKLNTPGPDCMTNVTGFGLASHALELARGDKAGVAIDWANVPLLHGVPEMVEQGTVTGAAGRDWAGQGDT